MTGWDAELRAAPGGPSAPEVRRFGDVGHGRVRIFLRFTRALPMFSIAVGAVVLAGYVTSAAPLLRPVAALPATHPFTLISAMALAAGMLLSSPFGRPTRAARLAFSFAVTVALMHVIELMLRPSGAFTFGAAWVSDAAGALPPITMGLDTALTVVMIGAAQLLRCRLRWSAFALAALAPFLPATAFTGYAFGLRTFLGAMPVYAVLMLWPLSIAGLRAFVRRMPLRALVSDTLIGKLARAQLLAGLLVPFAVGLVLNRVLPDPHGYNDALVITSTIWFFCSSVIVGSYWHERTDARRRQIERLLRYNSVTDRLTGVANRYGVTLAFGRIMQQGPVGVILADLDRFKQVNDTFGHSVGDRVLVQAALAMRAVLRGTDTMARWGGEEFLVVLPGAGPAETVLAAERLRAALHAMPGPGGEAGEVTASFGVSVLGQGESTLEAAILRADSALYGAKGHGRDRVTSDLVEPAVAPKRGARGGTGRQRAPI